MALRGNKYKDTIFDPNIKINVPIKNSENKEYFFNVTFRNIGYISLQSFFIFIGYYLILGFFWFNLYQSHFVITTLLVALNVTFSLMILLREKRSGKNMVDMLIITYRFMKKKTLYILKANKKDLFSIYQREKI